MRERVATALIATAGLLCALLATCAARADGIAPSRLSLPNGPASIEGLGSNFEPSLASGTASYNVPIAIPPAVGGLSPALSLTYDGSQGVSEVGLGWRLGGLPRIRRRAEDGLPLFDDSDRFELLGLGTLSELIEVEPGRYRPRYEDGSFVRVERNPDSASWEARTKSGRVYRFGGEGFVEAEGNNVATYLLREQLDLHGHRIRYHWDCSEGWALLTSVTLNEVTPEARIQVSFEYEARPDPHVAYAAGIVQHLSRRLAAIEVSRGSDLVRRYQLSYGEGIHPQPAVVQAYGADGETALPAVRFEYTAPHFAADGRLTVMQSPPGRSPGEADVALADLNGDGLPDLLAGAAGRYRSYLNHDGTRWLDAYDWSSSDSPSVSLSERGVDLADVDGDGAIDLLVKSGTDSLRYLPGLAGTHFGASVPIATVPNFSFEDPDVRLADMDGDRRTDVIMTTAAGLAIGYNLDGRDWTEPTTIGVVDPKYDLRFSDGGSTQLCDVNGDRVQDLCHLRPAALTYWLGRGRGRFEPARTATGVPDFDPASAWQLAELNGDGWVDLLHIGVDGIACALARGIGQFDEPLYVGDTPEQLDTTTVKLADMNGSGTTDIVWVDVSGAEMPAWQYLELFPDGRGGLLRRIDNGLGKIVRIQYEPAAAGAARARERGEPWIGRINVSMPVVSRVEIDSSLGDPTLATEYEYRDGTWDPIERTFAGFAGGTQTQLGDASTPTLVSKRSFDTGLVHRPLRGQIVMHESHDEHGYVFARLVNEYATPTLEAGLDGSAIEYAYRSSQRIDHLEGVDASSVRSVLNEWEQDEFGNLIREVHWGEIEGDDRLVGDDESVTVRTFANHRDEWLLGYVVTEELQDASGDRLALKRRYYDGEPFEGRALGEVTRGDLRRVESWIEGDRFADEERSDHDEHGNVISAYDSHGSLSEYEYDPESSCFVVVERRLSGAAPPLEWRGRYDARFGLPTEVTGPNGEQHRMRYDALGRLTALVEPGDSLELPTVQYRYDLASPLSTIRTETRERSGEAATLWALEYVDGLGRKRGRLEEAAEPDHSILSGLSRFDARGNVSFSAFPTEEASTDLPGIGDRDGTEQRYDASGRTLATIHPDRSSTNTRYLPLAREESDENDSDSSSEHYGTPTTYRLDGLGRLVEVIERDGDRELLTGSYAYDAAGNLTQWRDALGRERRYRYDGRSRRVEIDDPNAGRWQFEYTDGDDLQRRVDPAGQVVRTSYDGFGRVLERWQLGSGTDEEQLVARFHYDGASPAHPEYTTLRGSVSWVEDEAGEVFLDYDERGRVKHTTRRWPDGTEHTTFTDYDAADRPVRRGFPDQSALALTYDAAGRLSAIGPVVSSIHWTPDGQLASLRLGNGILDERGYDSRRRLRRLGATSPSGRIVRGLGLSLDAASRLTQVEDLRPEPADAERLDATYRYDDRYRLLEAGDRLASTSFSYDDLSNLLSIESGHAAPWLNVENRFGENGAGPDQLTHHGDTSIRYDAAGRVVDDGERLLEWDASGRLVRVLRGEVVEEYIYDFEDRRVVKRTTQGDEQSTVRYIDEDVEERDGQLVRYVLLGEQRVARLDPLAGNDLDHESDSEPLPTSVPTAPRGPFGRGSVPLVLLVAIGLLLALATLARRVVSRRRRVAAVCWTAAAVGVALLVPGCGRESSDHGNQAAGEGDESASSTQRREGGESEEPAPITELPEGAVFYLGDQQQSPLVLTNGAGEVVRTLAYHPYGSLRRKRGESPDPFGYVGNERDSAAGLSDFRARPYRPELGIFLAPDPVAVFEPESLLEKPSKLFAYTYSSADPTNVVDRDGRCGAAANPFFDPCTKFGQPPLPEAAQQAIDEGARKGSLAVIEEVAFQAAGMALVKRAVQLFHLVRGARAATAAAEAERVAAAAVRAEGFEAAPVLRAPLRTAGRSAASQGEARLSRAYQFMRSEGNLSPKKATQYLGGIDPTKPVEVVRLDRGRVFAQHVRDGRVGQWFGRPGATAPELGVAPVGRNPTLFVLQRDTTALRSTAAGTVDFWTAPPQRLPVPGGGTQYFAADSGAFSANYMIVE